jgi:hypothetical protein
VDEQNPMAEAEAQLYARIQQLRAKARAQEPPPPPATAEPAAAAAAVPDLRTLLARAESHVDELRSTAAELSRTLPDRIETAVERALDDHSNARRMGELRDLLIGLSAQVNQLNRDLLSERLGRIEDLELVVELISTGMAGLRNDVSQLTGDVGHISGGVDAVVDKLDQPLQVTMERTSRQAGVRDLFRPTESETASPGTTPGR